MIRLSTDAVVLNSVLFGLRLSPSAPYHLINRSRVSFKRFNNFTTIQILSIGLRKGPSVSGASQKFTHLDYTVSSRAQHFLSFTSSSRASLGSIAIWTVIYRSNGVNLCWKQHRLTSGNLSRAKLQLLRPLKARLLILATYQYLLLIRSTATPASSNSDRNKAHEQATRPKHHSPVLTAARHQRSRCPTPTLRPRELDAPLTNTELYASETECLLAATHADQESEPRAYNQIYQL